MSKYRFRLEPLRKLRAMHRDGLRVSLAEAYQAEQVLIGHQTAVANEQAELRELQRTTMRGGQLDVSRLADAQRYEMVLKAEQQQLVERSQQLAVEIERRRQAVVEADRSVRALELLDERQRRQHQQEQQRRETKQMDEMATMRSHADRRARQSQQRDAAFGSASADDDNSCMTQKR